MILLATLLVLNLPVSDSLGLFDSCTRFPHPDHPGWGNLTAAAVAAGNGNVAVVRLTDAGTGGGLVDVLSGIPDMEDCRERGNKRW